MVFFLVSWSLSLRRHRIIEKKKKEQERNGAKVAEQIVSRVFLFRMMSTLKRAKMERSMIELAPFSINVRSKGFFGEPLKHVITRMWANFGCAENWRKEMNRTSR